MAEQTRWPKGARAAVAFTIDNMGEAADLDRGLWPSSQPIGSHYAVLEVLPQFLELLKKYDIDATYFIESWNLSVYPEAIRNVAAAGHEVAWHAWRHEAWGKLDVDAERTNFQRSFGDEGLAGFVRKPDGSSNGVDRYHGFRPPGGTIHGQRTLKLCREYGLEYISPAAEQAAMVAVDGPEDQIAILPFKWSTVDAYYYMETFGKLRELKGRFSKAPQSPDVLTRSYTAEIDQAIASGGFVSVLFHPFLTNEPDRLRAMEEVIQYLARKREQGEVWLARCRDIADWLHAHPDTVGKDPQWDNSSWR